MFNVGDWVCLKNNIIGSWGPANRAQKMNRGWDVIVDVIVKEGDLEAGQARTIAGGPCQSPIPFPAPVICTDAHFAQVTHILLDGQQSVKIDVYVPYA